VGCIYLENGYCSAPLINIDPDEGCLTFTQLDDPFEATEDWEEELEGFEEWDEEDFDDDWLDEDDDF